MDDYLVLKRAEMSAWRALQVSWLIDSLGVECSRDSAIVRLYEKWACIMNDVRRTRFDLLDSQDARRLDDDFG